MHLVCLCGFGRYLRNKWGGAWGVLFCVAVVSVLQVVSDHRRVCVFVEWCALKSEAKRTCNCVQCFCAAPPTSRQIRKFKRSQSQMSHASADLARTGWWCTDLLKANRQCQPLDGEAGTAHVTTGQHQQSSVPTHAPQIPLQSLMLHGMESSLTKYKAWQAGRGLRHSLQSACQGYACRRCNKKIPTGFTCSRCVPLSVSYANPIACRSSHQRYLHQHLHNLASTDLIPH
jgi:hypothetical protein